MNQPKDIQVSFQLDEMPVVKAPEEAPLIFLDGFQGLGTFNDVVRINGFQLIQDVSAPDAPPKRAFVARLAMSSATLGQLMTWLNDLAKQQAQTESDSSADKQ